jgi:hypothetical protein
MPSASPTPELLAAVAAAMADRLQLSVEVASLGGDAGARALLVRHGEVVHLLAPRLPIPQNPAASAITDEPASPVPSGTIVVADALEPASRSALRERGIAHADTLGAVWLRLSGLLVDVDPRDGTSDRRRGGRKRKHESGSAAARPLVNPFTDAGGLLLRAFLRDPSRVWTQQALAKETKLSKGFVSDSIRSLQKHHHIIEEKIGGKVVLRLDDPVRLLVDWLPKVTPPGPARHAFFMDAPLDARERLLAEAFGGAPFADRWALTLHAAGRHLAPHVVQDQLHAYVAEESVDAAAARLEDDFFLARVAPGQAAQANIHLLVPHDRRGTFVDARVVDGGVRVVSPLQLFLDVAHWPVRGPEAASALVRGPLGDQLRLDAAQRRALADRFE